MNARSTPAAWLLTVALAMVAAPLVIEAGVPDAAQLCVSIGCPLPVEVVVDSADNMPAGLLAHTTVSHGRCFLTFTPESRRRRDVVAHEACHCALDSDVLGPYGYEGISHQEQRRREARVVQCARRRAGDPS